MRQLKNTIKMIKQSSNIIFNVPQKIEPIRRKSSFSYEFSDSGTDQTQVRQIAGRNVSLTNCVTQQQHFDLFSYNKMGVSEVLYEDDYEKGRIELEKSTQVTQLKIFISQQIINTKGYLDNCDAFEYLTDKYLSKIVCMRQWQKITQQRLQ
ncbi:Hypothetical_protein [Hexamita inflata]|uniref:Hypothetical_protein n=1 Tax=Hexamita inflata TaxID=28002 RepID=A0AA86U1N1_9EUKA|nr:Hypothetical protein HINF_LOCUS26220 [Hexamita inflata]